MTEYSLHKVYKGLDYHSLCCKEFMSDADVEVFLRLYCLLYADDTIVMAENPEDLQIALNCVYDYCHDWNLTVNTSKTKVVIYSKGKIRKRPDFSFGKDKIVVIDDYVYLGCTFNYNGKYNKAITKQVNQAKRAMFSLLSKSMKLNLPTDITCDLFDSLVTPILLYGCEIWGFDNANTKIIETFHYKFCKQILKVQKRTASCMVLGELGRLKLKRLIDKPIFSNIR